MNQHRILLVEDGPGPTWLSWAHLHHKDYHVEIIASGESALERIQRVPFPDALVFNISKVESGASWIANLRRSQPQLRIVALFPRETPERDLQAFDLGETICAWKPCEDQALDNLLQKCLHTTSAMGEAEHIPERPGDVEELPNGRFFVMASPAMRKLRDQVAQVARIDVPVLVLGESGTGKEVVARLIHGLSSRSQRMFLKVNCAALPSELLESELFGYERGAFTGAVKSKPGKLEICNNGTLFLDEIGEMPPAIQAKLLHFLQDHEFSRLGSCSRIKVNVRVLAATNINIKAAISYKAFREDLYYRLSTFVFSVPPLRDRKEDIRVLFHRYMKHHADELGLPPRLITRDVWNLCVKYHWPGNVRELENLAKRYIICGEEALEIGGSMPPQSVGSEAAIDRGPESPSGDFKTHVRDVRESAEAFAIMRTLEQTNWNRSETARILKISYKSVLSKIRRYGLDQTSREAVGEYKIGNNGSAYRIQSAK
jgi:two-component system, NtrC family, response regulator AtoC